jgi:fructosamine-3-kinase
VLSEPVLELHSIAGGDINQAFEARLTSGRRVFVKTHAQAPAGAYASEARGLGWLAEPGSLRVPAVLGVSERVLVLTFIERGARGSRFDEAFGRGLAQLHKAGAEHFGFAEPGFLANLAQDNTPCDSWPHFYAERRLLPFAQRALNAGALGSGLLRRIEALCARVPGLCSASEPPSRLHGDLWSGNVMADAEGAPVIFDPAAYAGEREVDLAMLQLFGSPGARFFSAYAEVYPPKAGASERVALYQLLPLLVHVILFGASYLGQLEHALGRYE